MRDLVGLPYKIHPQQLSPFLDCFRKLMASIKVSAKSSSRDENK